MSRAPAYPSTRWVSDTQPKLFTNAGTASGATSSTCQSRRAGRSLRSTSHAAAGADQARENDPAHGQPGGVEQQFADAGADEQGPGVVETDDDGVDDDETQGDQREESHCGRSDDQEQRG